MITPSSTRIAFCGLALVVATASTALASEADELKSLAGQWELTGLTQNGQEVPEEQLPGIRIEFMEGGSAIAHLPEGRLEANVSLDTESNPKQIDTVHTAGPYEDQSQYGIYELDGDTFTIAMTDPGADEEDRPADFAYKLVMTFHRVN